MRARAVARPLLRPALRAAARRRARQVPPACAEPHVRSHVILPKHVSKNAPKGRLLSESEWRGLGVQQSRGWVHYAIHRHVPAATPTRGRDACALLLLARPLQFLLCGAQA